MKKFINNPKILVTEAHRDLVTVKPNKIVWHIQPKLYAWFTGRQAS